MPRDRRPKRTHSKLPPVVLPALLLIAIAVIVYLRAPWPLQLWLLAMNGATFIAYAYDKVAAIKAWRRIPERTLHGLALLGGSPAAWFGQAAFRHKTIKRPFQIRFALILVLQFVLLGAWSWYRYRLP